jgi:hypothetical protein
MLGTTEARYSSVTVLTPNTPLDRAAGIGGRI